LGKIPGEICVIPINRENYTSVPKKIKCFSESFEIRFLDTYRCMPLSLDTLASNLVDDQMNTVKSFLSNDIEFQLLRKKGIFPYEYLYSANRLEETSLPPRNVLRKIMIKLLKSGRTSHVSLLKLFRIIFKN